MLTSLASTATMIPATAIPRNLKRSSSEFAMYGKRDNTRHFL